MRHFNTLCDQIDTYSERIREREVEAVATMRRDCVEMMREREVEAEVEVEVVKEKAEDGAASVVRWERFLPRVALRVLLVESDDSTRKIIAALLRKSGYKVAAVGDGLKAWEFLKGKSQNIDLILTEVDLPSISGFALLTLIMEHDICKNIPVIMMSAQDSVSTVYKYMLRGAADFLVKPVRINELRNLWQHVWRRQSSISKAPQDKSAALQKLEATAENSAVNSPTSDYVACAQRNKECIEKASDAQSSCTKPDAEVEMIRGDNPYNLSHMKINSQEIDTDTKIAEQSVNLSWTKQDNKDSAIESEMQQVIANSSREAIDFIGAFSDYSNLNNRSSGVTDDKLDSSPMLDLSLWRSHPSGSVNQVSDDRYQSDVSAFSRYAHMVPQSFPTPTSICNQNISERHFSDHTFNYYSDTHSSALTSQKNILSSGTVHSLQAGVSFPNQQQRLASIPLPVRGLKFGDLSPTYGSIVSAHHQSNPQTRNSHQVDNSMDQHFKNSVTRVESYQRRKLDSSEDQSMSSSLYNGTGCGNSGVVESENKGPSMFGTNSQRNVEREAALNKFRLKRKERCFDKKVRYESRKKLAEQRPRVRGQFVRQMPAHVGSRCDNLA